MKSSNRPVSKCIWCGGEGVDEQGETCTLCQGYGQVYECDECHGDGMDAEGDECDVCGGYGLIPYEEVIEDDDKEENSEGAEEQYCSWCHKYS